MKLSAMGAVAREMAEAAPRNRALPLATTAPLTAPPTLDPPEPPPPEPPLAPPAAVPTTREAMTAAELAAPAAERVMVLAASPRRVAKASARGGRNRPWRVGCDQAASLSFSLSLGSKSRIWMVVVSMRVGMKSNRRL